MRWRGGRPIEGCVQGLDGRKRPRPDPFRHRAGQIRLPPSPASNRGASTTGLQCNPAAAYGQADRRLPARAGLRHCWLESPAAHAHPMFGQMLEPCVLGLQLERRVVATTNFQDETTAIAVDAKVEILLTAQGLQYPVQPVMCLQQL